MIKVLVIDDSALVRKVISEILDEVEDIEVVATARDPLAAIEKIKKYRPDVLTLDLQMPRMDGLTFLRKLMVIHPMPVIVISSLSKAGSQEAIKSMELGAFDVVAKPTLGIKDGLAELSQDIVSKIRASQRANISSIKHQVKKNIISNNDKREKQLGKRSTIEMIVIGASTGGTVAVRKILSRLPSGLPGIIVVLHMPKMFTSSFAESLDRDCSFRVKEAEDGENFLPNTAYIAPGGYHMIVQRGVSDYYLKLDNGPKINHLRPNIDKTFKSVANIVAPNCLGILLTGMGKDGAEGLKMMHNRGANTFAQDEKSSVVFGMPAQAIRIGAVDRVLDVHDIPSNIMEVLEKN